VRAGVFKISNQDIRRGEKKEVRLKVSEYYTTNSASVPVIVIRGEQDGPRIFLTSAVHGDELVGVEIVRRIINEILPVDLSGILICVPVVNIFGFLNSTRYLPDRRDLNQYFPGDPKGSSAARMAHIIFQEIILKSDYGIDIHSAIGGRSNLAHVRADMKNLQARRIAKAFGTEIIIDHKGKPNSIHTSADFQSIPTIVFEGGETLKFDQNVVTTGVLGIKNVLGELKMINHRRFSPLFQVIVKVDQFIRTNRGGLMDIRVHPGQVVYQGEELARVFNPFGKEREIIRNPFTGMIIGVTTDPTVIPGTSVCHLVKLDKSLKMIEKAYARRKNPRRKSS
jgi:hypothetical protein